MPPSLDGGVVSTDFPVFDIDPASAIPEFLGWLVRTESFVDLCRAASEGTTNRVRLKEDRFLTTPIQLPPLNEQRRIVAKIERLSAKIEEARVLRTESTEHSEALMYSSSDAIFSALDVPRRLLATLTTRITKGESPEWQGFSYQESGPVFIRSENVLWGSLDMTKRICIPIAFHQKLNRSQLYPGDVLINLVGASIGRSCTVPDNIGDANINQAVAVISPNGQQLNSQYLMHYLLCPSAQEIIHGGKVETARPNISLGDLRELLIPVPPLAEQQRVVARIVGFQSVVRAGKILQMETARELNALMPSILSKAFSSEL